LTKSLQPSNNTVRNSFQLIQCICNTKISINEFFSLDVISQIWTPVNLMIGINNRWHLIQNNKYLTKDEFIDVIKLVLNSTFFIFNDKFYRQTFGVSMRSPISLIIADIVLQDLESTIFKKLTINLSFYVRYVDDIAFAIDRSINDHVEAFH